MECFVKIALFTAFLFTTALSIEIPQYSKTPADVQERAVKDVIRRTIGENAAERFTIKVGKTAKLRGFQLSKNVVGNIDIVGTDGVSVAKGFHYYLKYYLGKDITWTNTNVILPQGIELPAVNISSTSASTHIYYQNVCTWSYSFAWWSWSLWQQHIDWMAMMGISLTIAPIQEQIWYDLYSSKGLTDAEINEHFAGPAFQAWQRMGNIRGWLGPLSPTYRQMQLQLQLRILAAQRSLGMLVALPAFAGHLPTAVARLFPHVNFTAVERWNRFPNSFCCSLYIDPAEPLFGELGAQFLARIVARYGSDHIYFADPFNEMQPRLPTSDYLNATARNIYASMQAVDNEAIWLLQGWMFVKNVFWRDALIEAFLTAVPRGGLLVLDLQSEKFPQYERTHSFYGQPFIWCMLHNFGGTLGMHGSVAVINERIRAARNMANSTMIGVGITPEGINQNYVMYALALERAWVHDDFDLEKWFSTYADVRYGVQHENLRAAWQKLQQTVYAYYGLRRMRGKYAITRRPALNLDTWIWYNASELQAAWQLMLAANASVPASHYALYTHDLVDLTRQFLQVLADRFYVNMVAAFKKQQTKRLNVLADEMLALFDDLESILSSDVHFMLGPWLESAKMIANSPTERRLYELNARNQITAWGPTGQILDYATKQWSGIVHDYYRPRWSLFLELLQYSLREHIKFNGTAFKERVSRDIENPFTVQTTLYPLKASGDTFEISQQLFNKWTNFLLQVEDSGYLQVHTKIV